MRKSNHERIREYLRSVDEGDSVAGISKALDLKWGAVRRALDAMPDAYIDRWVRGGYRSPVKWIAVWCVVVVENCPKPE